MATRTLFYIQAIFSCRSSADQSEDFNILPSKSRRVDQILQEYSEYSDHEMDVFDVEERKKELRKKKHQKESLFNSYSKPTGHLASNAPAVSQFTASCVINSA